MYYTQILLCVVGFFQHYLFRYGVYGKTFECDFGEKIENEYFIYLINFFSNWKSLKTMFHVHDYYICLSITFFP